MNDCDCLNCQLQAKWRNYYEATEKAMRSRFSVYREIMGLLQQVCEEPLDIDEYWDVATHLGECLARMGEGTVFYNYFYEQIHPSRRGTVRHFRHLCQDLWEQIHLFNQWRCGRRQLKIVASSTEYARRNHHV